MALNASGPISLGGSTTGVAIAAELALSPTAQISLNDSGVRTLAGVASGAITMPTDFWGKSSGTPSFASEISVNTISTAISNVSINSTYTLMAMGLQAFTPPAGTVPLTTSYAAHLIVNTTTGNIVKVFKQGTVSAPNNSSFQISMDPNGNSYISQAYGTGGMILSKYNSSGVNQWTNLQASGGGSGTTMNPQGMVGDSSGNLYAAGGRNTPLDDAFLNKTDTSGNNTWRRQWGNGVSTSPDTTARGVVLDESTNILYTGNYNVFGSNPAPGTFKIAITRHNTSGVLQGNWTYWDSTNNRQLGFGNSNTDFTLSKTNNFMLMGTYSIANNTHNYLSRVNKSTGAVDWTRQITSPANQGIQYCTDPSDNIYVLVGNSGAGGNTYVYVVKYNSSGVLQWQRKLNKAGLLVGASSNNCNTMHFKDSGIVFPIGSASKGILVYVKDSDMVANKVFSNGLTFSTTTDVVDTAGPTISMVTSSFPTEYAGSTGTSAAPSYTDITSSVSNIVYT
jgi:hypothetical protein